jgi:putative ABC transport system substrate-binding protein
MRRRDFVNLLGSAAAAWPLTVRAQQPYQMRRVGMLLSNAEDREAQPFIAALPEELVKLGWTELSRRDCGTGCSLRLPAVNWSRSFTEVGGLISYGPCLVEECRRAASYVDRILKGEKPSDLPVQAPVKFELVINL